MDDLKDLIPLNSGGSYQLMADMLYHIRLLKYVTQDHLLAVNKRYNKICAIKKLDRLIELNYLENPSLNVYTATDKVLPIINKYGHNIKTLPKATGFGGINELNNTKVFIQALKLPDYKALIYPSFNYIRPDALLVRQSDKGYKLEFLEIEASKPDWNNWIENKRINYLKLAQDRQVFSYWTAQANYLNLPKPDIKNFRFSVSFIGKIKLDFGVGFNFMEKI